MDDIRWWDINILPINNNYMGEIIINRSVPRYVMNVSGWYILSIGLRAYIQYWFHKVGQIFHQWLACVNAGQPVISPGASPARQAQNWLRPAHEMGLSPHTVRPGKYTRPNPTWACTQYTVWRLTWMLWTMCHLAGLARLALGKTGRAQLDHIQYHLNSSELI